MRKSSDWNPNLSFRFYKVKTVNNNWFDSGLFCFFFAVNRWLITYFHLPHLNWMPRWLVMEHWTDLQLNQQCSVGLFTLEELHPIDCLENSVEFEMSSFLIFFFAGENMIETQWTLSDLSQTARQQKKQKIELLLHFRFQVNSNNIPVCTKFMAICNWFRDFYSPFDNISSDSYFRPFRHPEQQIGF